MSRRPLSRSPGVLCADPQILEREVGVDRDVAGEAEHTVPDDVALDLVGAARDAGRERRDHLLLEVAALLVVAGGPRLAGGAGDLQRDVAELTGDHRGRQLAE